MKFFVLSSIVISEGAPKHTFLAKITANDRDLNANIVFFLVKNNTSPYANAKFEAFDENLQPVNLDLVNDWFDIDPFNGTLYTNAQLDREVAEQITLVIGVEDLNATSQFKPQIKTSKFTQN